MNAFRYLLFAVVLFAAVQVVLASAQTCVVPTGADFVCYNETSYANTTGQSLSQWCAAQNGTIHGSVLDTGDQCIQVCCCDQATQTALVSGPISRDYCTRLQGAIASPGDSCDAVCSGQIGPSGPVFNVSGTVKEATGGSPLDAFVQYPSSQGSTLITVRTDASGAFSFPNVPGGPENFLAYADNCDPETITTPVTDGLILNFSLVCGVGTCQTTPINAINATPVMGEDKAVISWMPDSCTIGYWIYRCTAASDTGSACNGKPEPIGYVTRDQSLFVDTAVPLGQRTCYFVDTINKTYDDLPPNIPDDGANCIKAMDPYCVTHSHQLRCLNNEQTNLPYILDANGLNPASSGYTGTAYCDADNRFMAGTQCSGNQTCTYDAHGLPSCGDDTCNECNGVFGTYSVPSVGSTKCDNPSICVKTNLFYLFNTYENCGLISSCSGYHDPVSCEKTSGTYDSCYTTPQGCKWVDWPNMSSLGKGVCVAKNSSQESCGDCSSVFGFCNATLCSSLGSGCYYDGTDCVSSSDMGCSGYVTQPDCNGGQDDEVNVTYDDPNSVSGQRIAGDNTVQRSNDLFRYGVCTWVPDGSNANGGYCIKDADGLRIRSDLTGALLDDCYQDGLPHDDAWISKCESDVTPPNTTLPFSPNESIDAQQLRDLKPIVSDDMYAYSDLKTWFCLVPRGESCYPNQTIDEVFPDKIGTQVYTLRYYSEDPAGNLEPVKSIDLNVYKDSSPYLQSVTLLSGNVSNVSANISANVTGNVTNDTTQE